MQQEQDGDISLPREDVKTSPSTTLRKLSLASDRASHDQADEDDTGDGDGGDLGISVQSDEEEGEDVSVAEGDLGSDVKTVNEHDAGNHIHSNNEGEEGEQGHKSEQLDTIDIDTNDSSDAVVPSSDTVTAARQHTRTDSVPLQRYSIEQTSPQAARRMRELTDEDHGLATKFELHHTAHQDGTSRHVSETEDAGLDFVDVQLGNGTANESALATSLSFATHSNSPYGPGGFAASRSAVEIRQDSISSDSVKARELARKAEAMEQQQQQQQRTEGQLSSSDHWPSREERSEQQQHWLHQRIDSSEVIRRSVEGRYMGRRSQSNSPVVSPSASRRNSVSVHRASAALGPMPGPSGGASSTVTMSFAGDDGDIDTVISPTDLVLPSLSVNDDVQQNGDQAEPAAAMKQESSARSLKDTSQDSQDNEVDKHDQAATDTGDSAPPPDDSNGAPAGESTAIILTDAADKAPQKGDKARRESQNRPSALEQHLSRTRMSNLPPKPKTEDVKHLHDFEAMMRQWREMEARKQQEEYERRNKRDDGLHERMKVWERDILPSWTRARREARLRKLWWKGVPPNLRGRVWALACGNSQMLPRNLFSKASAEARQARADGTFPANDLEAMEADVEDTLPTLRLFQRGTGALHDDLIDVLSAFTIVRLQQKREQHGGDDDGTAIYPIGAASLAAMLLMNLSPSETLIALINLIAERPWLRALYSLSASTTAPTARRRASRAYSISVKDRAVPTSPTTPLRSVTSSTSSPVSSAQRLFPSSAALAGFERVFDTLLADQMPKVYANMQARGVRPSAYVNDWIRTLFVPFLPFDAAARLWDCILLEESDALLFRTGIALVSLLSARLYVPDKDELVSILHGNNRAAIAVWTRVRTGSTVDALQSPTRKKRVSVAGNAAAVGNAANNGEDPHDEKRDDVGGLPRSTSEGDAVASSVYAPDELVPLDEIYGGQYGITEENLFRALDEQDGWWKDSTLERLLDREVVS